jgi:hypothetical protein
MIDLKGSERQESLSGDEEFMHKMVMSEYNAGATIRIQNGRRGSTVGSRRPMSSIFGGFIVQQNDRQSVSDCVRIIIEDGTGELVAQHAILFI